MLTDPHAQGYLGASVRNRRPRTNAERGHDLYPTPGWATRALMEEVLAEDAVQGGSVWEPACGKGHMSRVLAEYMQPVLSSDIVDYGFGQVQDFLTTDWPIKTDWIITNPPFGLAEKFVHRALEFCPRVAIFARLNFLEGQRRHARDVQTGWA